MFPCDILLVNSKESFEAALTRELFDVGVGKGTRPGLATVQSIVTRSGGSVTVDSEVGKGTSFTVYLPQAGVADGVIVAQPPEARPPVGVQTVLVVEDAAGLREVTRRLLERLGLRHQNERERMLVRKGGFEPPRSCDRQPLKLVRLPFRHFRVQGVGLSSIWHKPDADNRRRGVPGSLRSFERTLAQKNQTTVVEQIRIL